MKDDAIKFIPVGGGQSVGASCYYMKIGDEDILLDCGTGIRDGKIYEPDLYQLVMDEHIKSLRQIKRVFISHAHIDHTGYLQELIKKVPDVQIIMTQGTAVMMQNQICGSYCIEQFSYNDESSIDEISRSSSDNTVIVNYFQTIDFGEYKATFYNAGHITGAMMVLFEYKGKKILYTGDFSVKDTPLVERCYLPENIHIDTVIMCAVHARNKNYLGERKLVSLTDMVLQNLNRGISVFCSVKQLSKGIEFLSAVNEANKKSCEKYDIYIDDDIFNSVKKVEKLYVPIITSHNYNASYRNKSIPHLLIGKRLKVDTKINYKKMNIDFSLHNDFDELNQFIKRIMPSEVIIVHCDNKNMTTNENLLQEETNINCYYPKNGEIAYIG